MIYHELQKFSESISDLDVYLKANPTNLKGLQLRAFALLKLGNEEKAKVDLQQILKVDPKNNFALKQLNY